MNAVVTAEMPTGLALLRQPFPDHQVSKLPKGSKTQNDCPAAEKINCKVCGGWHHPKVPHLDYVGHAAVTDRLLDADPTWYWEPLAYTEQGLPRFDESGGLWIKLYVCSHHRIGYGHAAASTYKDIGSREKEVIGDAIRNAAMRFGAALELWHKGDLHLTKPIPDPEGPEYINEKQGIEIHDFIVESKANTVKFLAYMGVTEVASILAKDYDKAITALKQQEKAMKRAAEPKA